MFTFASVYPVLFVQLPSWNGSQKLLLSQKPRLVYLIILSVCLTWISNCYKIVVLNLDMSNSYKIYIAIHHQTWTSNQNIIMISERSYDTEIYTGINDITVILNCQNILRYYGFYCIFDQICSLFLLNIIYIY